MIKNTNNAQQNGQHQFHWNKHMWT